VTFGTPRGDREIIQVGSGPWQTVVLRSDEAAVTVKDDDLRELDIDL
jgi:hypothetical protein